MFAADDLRPLFTATLAGAIVFSGQIGALASALGGSSLATLVVWVVLAALAAFAVVARSSGRDGAMRRVLEGAVAALVVWFVLENAVAEWPLGGLGLDHAAGVGAGAAVALAGRTPLRLAVRFAAVAVAIGVVYLLDTRGLVESGLGFLVPVAAVAAVVLLDGAVELVGRGRLLAATLILAVPVAAPLAAALIEAQQAEEARRAHLAASQPPPARVGRERIAWVFPARDFYTGPLVAGNVVVADARDGVHGVDAETGEERWLAKLPGRDGLTEPLLDRGLLLYPANLAGLHALDVQNGRQVWRFRPPLETQIWGVAPAGELLVVGGWGPSRGRLFGVRRADGHLLWTRAVAGDQLDLTAGERGVRVDSERGSWLVGVRGRLVPTEPPVAEPDYTFGRTKALRSREQGWIFRPGWEASTSEPVVADGVVFVNVALDPAKLNGGLYALDARSGRVRWRVEIAGDAEHRPAVRGPLVYVTSTDTCAAVGGCRTGLYAVRR